MKKLSFCLTVGLMVLTLFLVGTQRHCLASDRACDPIWTDVAGQTYDLDGLEVVFSGSYAGPCPQGIVEVYDGIYIAPVLECIYTSQGNNIVVVNCDGVELSFRLDGNKLRIVDPNAPYMTRQIVDE